MNKEQNPIFTGVVREIRPKVVFQKVEQIWPDKNVTFNVSIPASDIGGLTLLESAVLVSLVKLLSPTELFEFGTYMGASTVLLAVNSETNASITTLDLDAATIAPVAQIIDEKVYLVDDTANDNRLRQVFANKGPVYIDRSEPATQAKIRRLHQDSRTLKLSEQCLKGRFQFIFIDGGHDYETIKIDTLNALGMASKDAVIMWHDYRSKIHGDVTQFVDEFSRDHSVIHVQNTMLAFMFLGKFASILD